jgi:site-specific DNA-methyltransferase (adenine-specific)
MSAIKKEVVIGDCRLLLGDCLDILPTLGAVDAVVTDPPYGTTACKWDAVIPLEPMWEQLKRIIKPNGAIVMTASQPFTTTLIASNMKMFKYCWVWDKKQTGNPFLAKKQPLKVHEDIIVFGGNKYFPQMRIGKMRKKGGGKKSLIFGNTDEVINNMYYPVSILEVPNCANRKGRLHPTQKPVALMEYLIKTYTNEGETVLDFTMGSGTTGVAAKNLNRNFIGIELDPEYFKIAKKRIEAVQNNLFN